MSDARRKCVCGKERGKEPVVITITTCRHLHSVEGERGFSILTGPLATSSKIDVKETKPQQLQKTAKEDVRHEKSQQTTPQRLEKTVKKDEQSEEAKQISSQETISLAMETALESMIDENVNKTQNTESQRKESLHINDDENVKSNKVAKEHDATEVTKEQNTSKLDDAEQNSAEFQSLEEPVQEEPTNPTVMMLTETSVNTLPFLNNLFTPNYATKLTSNNLKDNNNNYCTTELLVFEKHLKNCEHKLNTGTTVFDGDTVLEVVGGMPFPNSLNKSKSESFILSLDTTKKEKRHLKILQMLEAYITSKQFIEVLNYPTIGTHLQKYNNSGQNVTTTDRSVQFEDSHFLSTTRSSKWYDSFLICLGLKSNKDKYDDDCEMQAEGSLFLVCRYLKI